MREIKFRVWTGNQMFHITHEAELQLNFGINDGWALWEPYGELCTHKDGELMQYTNLKDKNGVEIYEGDIVKQTYHIERGSYDDVYSFDGHHIGEVLITARGVCIKNPLHYSMETDETKRMKMYKPIAGYRSEVIGNVHQHPNLLQEG